MVAATGGGVLASAVIRQALVPMVAGYLIVMVPLGLALISLQRQRAGTGAGGRRGPGRPQAPPGAGGPAGDRASGWKALLGHMAATAAGGYLLLTIVVFGYYYGVARAGSQFLKSAITGPALLIALTMPAYAALCWLLARRAARRGPSRCARAGRGGGH